MKKHTFMLFCSLSLLACDKQPSTQSQVNSPVQNKTQYPVTWYPSLGIQFKRELTQVLKTRKNLQQLLKKKWMNPVEFRASDSEAEEQAKMDAELAAELVAEKAGIELDIDIKIEPKPVVVSIQSCDDYFSTTLKGLELTKSNAREVYHFAWITLGCQAIKLVIKGNDADSSHIGKIILNKAFADVLPIEMAFYISSDEEKFVSKHKGKSLSYLNKIEKVTDSSDYMVTYNLDDAMQTIFVLARGDFNDDKVEDILLLVQNSITGASYRSISLFVVTRDSDDSIFRVIKEY